MNPREALRLIRAEYSYTARTVRNVIMIDNYVCAYTHFEDGSRGWMVRVPAAGRYTRTHWIPMEHV